MRSKKLIERIARSIASSNRVSYYPLVVKEAHDSTVVDVDGREYIDFNAGWTVAGLGYSNSEVLAAIEEELESSTGLVAITFPNETTVEFAERLLDITPGTFEKRVWFGHSGTDACGAAYKLLPIATKRQRIVSFYGGMHGIDLAGMAMGGHPATARYPVPSLVSKVPYAYCYRCPYGLEYPSCGLYCAGEFIEGQLFKYVNPPEDTSFMIVESMQSDSGDVVPPEGYLESLKRTCESHGILFVADEVKVGFGRTGRMFGVDHAGVVPDAIALGKSMASGIPVGALVARKGLMEGGFAASTLVGNAVGAAAGLATLRVIERRKIPARAAREGAYLKRRLDELKGRHRLIGDVRGKGLFLGMELVKDRRTKEPARLETAKTVFRAWQLGLLTVYVGPDGNVIEVTPPLIVTRDELDRGVEILDRAIGDVERGRVPDSAVGGYAGF